MSYYQPGGTVTFVANAALTEGLRVKLTLVSGVLQAAKAAANEDYVGVTLGNAAAQGDLVPVALKSSGIIMMETNNAVVKGALVYGAANGRVDDATTGTELRVGIALEAASAAGEQIPVLPFNQSTAFV